jgi:phosphonate transport system permease protein
MTGLVHRPPAGLAHWRLPGGRAGFATLVAVYAVLVALCLAALVAAGDLSIGRNPWDNLLRTLGCVFQPIVDAVSD